MNVSADRPRARPRPRALKELALKRKRTNAQHPFAKALLFIAAFFPLAVAVLAADPTPSVSQSPESDTSVLARIDDVDIKIDDVRNAIANLDSRQRAALVRDPSLLNQLVRSILSQRVVLNEALAKKWDQEPATTALLQRVRDNAIVESFLQSVSQPPASYPNETELKAAYESSKAALLVPRQYHLAQIFVSFPRTAEKADADKAQAKLETIKRGLHQRDADFAAIARANSDEQDSAGRGGEIGWLTETQIQPEIRSQVTTMTRGSVSEPIRLDDGWHVLRLIEIKEAYTPSLDEVKTPLTQQLRAQRGKANSQAYVAQLLQKHPVAINELALSKVLPKTQK